MVLCKNDTYSFCVPLANVEIVAEIFKHACPTFHLYHKRSALWNSLWFLYISYRFDLLVYLLNLCVSGGVFL